MAEDTFDYYEVLGVARTATAEEIKNAYDVISFKYSPDRIKNNKKLSDAEREEARVKFIRANEAYPVLRDEKLRAAYDSGGVAAVERAKTGASAPITTVAPTPARVKVTAEDMIHNFMKEGSTPTQVNTGGKSSAEIRAAADLLRRQRREAELRGETLAPIVPVEPVYVPPPPPAPAPAPTPAPAAPFRDAAQRVDEATRRLKQSDMVEVPLGVLEQFRGNMQSFFDELDRAIETAKKRGPRP